MEIAQILIVEDDPDILELVQYNLERRGFKVLTSDNGEDGLKVAQDKLPDLVVLDLMLPKKGGLTVCQQLKEDPRTKDIPVVMLTAKGEENDIVTGLEVGADDYVTKPFSPKELTARVRAVLRRSGAVVTESDQILEVGPIKIDCERHEVYVNGRQINFTLAEFNLLAALAQKPGRVYTRDQLLEKMGKGEIYLIDRNVDVHVRSIRKKLEAESNIIQTIRGIGYKCREFNEIL